MDIYSLFLVINSKKGAVPHIEIFRERVIFRLRFWMVNANAESAPTYRINQARLAQVHPEQSKINAFAVGEAHQKWKKMVWAGEMRMGAISHFLEAVGNLKSSRLTPDHRTEWESENQSSRSFLKAVQPHRDGKQIP